MQISAGEYYLARVGPNGLMEEENKAACPAQFR
jgi:hypothetical protein